MMSGVGELSCNAAGWHGTTCTGIHSACASTRSCRLCMYLELDFAGQAFLSAPVYPMNSHVVLAYIVGQVTGRVISVGSREVLLLSIVR
jgi:DNA-binding IclR family transcriptional regulator